jgi:hypothetical protein
MVAVPSSSDTTSDMEESFAALFEESLKRDEVKEGEIVKGKVIAHRQGQCRRRHWLQVRRHHRRLGVHRRRTDDHQGGRHH